MTPQVQAILVIVVIGAIAGWLAGVILAGGGFGLIGNIVVGILGAVIGGYLFPLLGLRVSGDPLIASIITATAGALILVFILGLLRR